MPSTIKIHSGGTWVPVADGNLYIRRNGAWVSPTKVYIRRAGVWVDTGFVGKPSPLTNFSVIAEDYTRIQVSATAASSGVPTTALRIYLLNSAGTYLQGNDYATGPGGTVQPNFTGLSTDTNYIVRAWAVGAGGVLSNQAADIRRRTGHPSQGYNSPNYGWSAEIRAIPAQIDGTSEYEYGGYPGAKAVDGDTYTGWVSGANADPNAFAALVFQALGGNRLLVRIGMVTWDNYNPNGPNSHYQIGYCGIWINGVLTYNVPIGDVGPGNGKQWNVEGYGWNLQNVTKFNISMTNLVSWPLAYRAEIAEVWYYYKDWVIVSYTWIETVAYAYNSAW